MHVLTKAAKVDGATANIMVAISLIIGTPFFIVFGALSDKIGRKPIIMAGCLLAVLTYFPLFNALTTYANPKLAAAIAKSPYDSLDEAIAAAEARSTSALRGASRSSRSAASNRAFTSSRVSSWRLSSANSAL